MFFFRAFPEHASPEAIKDEEVGDEHNQKLEGDLISLDSSNKSEEEFDFHLRLDDGSSKEPESVGSTSQLYITMLDFKQALKCVQTYAKREGFNTVPDATWDDIGSLKDIKEQLKISILVN